MGKLSRKDRQGIALMVGSTLLVLAGLVVFHLLPKKPLLDETSMCPVSGELSHYAVLVDKSDKWGDADVERVSALVSNVQKSVPLQGRLSVYVIHGEDMSGIGTKRARSQVDLIFDMCNPGGEEACNALYQNCKKLQKTFHEEFEVPFERLSRTLARPGESDSSPILEAVGTMLKDTHSSEVHLFLVSDFMENHLKFRFYDEIPIDDEMIAEYPLPARTTFKVQGFQIERRTHPTRLRTAVRDAWVGYFEKQGADVDFQPIFASD